MLLENENLVLIDVDAESPEQAIEMAGHLLVKEGKVEPSYVEEMVNGFQKIGPYIVLAPGIAIPHARPEHGVNEQCLALVRLKNPINFGHPTNDPVQIVCAIGGTDNHGHIGMLQSLSSVLGDKEKLHGILNASDYSELSKFFI